MEANSPKTTMTMMGVGLVLMIRASTARSTTPLLLSARPATLVSSIVCCTMMSFSVARYSGSLGASASLKIFPACGDDFIRIPDFHVLPDRQAQQFAVGAIGK